MNTTVDASNLDAACQAFFAEKLKRSPGDVGYISEAIKAAIAAAAAPDTKRLRWLEDQIVDTIYLDDGRIIDVRGHSVRKAIDDAIAAGDRDAMPSKQRGEP